MSIMDVLKATGRGIGKLPRMIGDAEYDSTPIYQQGAPTDMPSMPISAQMTPDGPTYDMDMGGDGTGMPGPPVQVGTAKRKNAFGRFMGSAPDILRAGVSAAATPNIAYGGPTDVFRGIAAGQQSEQDSQDRHLQQQRQVQQDSYLQAKREADIRDINAQEQERLRKASLPARYGGPWVPIGGGKEANRETGEIRSAPTGTGFQNGAPTAPAASAGPAPDTVSQKTKELMIENATKAGGYESPDTETAQYGVGGPIKAPFMVSNIPAPEGYNAVPYTSGQHRMVQPSIETVNELKHPAVSHTKFVPDGKGGMVPVTTDNQGSEPVVGNALPGVNVPQRAVKPPKPSITDTVKDRQHAADQIGLTDPTDPRRLEFIANGRLTPTKPSGGTHGGKDDPEELKRLMRGFAGLPDSAPVNQAPAPAPAAKPVKPPTQPPPPEVTAKIPVGQKTWLKDADGNLQYWIKNPDGKMQRLR